MKKFRVLYIDEQKSARELFELLEDDDLEIIAIHPLPVEKDMMEYIMSKKFDAVIVDYGLMKDDARIKYNGNQIINDINELKEDFPALIFTQDIAQDDGVDEKIQSTKILMKDDLDVDNLETLRRKIKSYIKYYKKENQSLSGEFQELINKRKQQDNKLSDDDLERLKYLDEKIERRLNGRRMFPNLLKDSENLKSLNSLLKDAEEFLKKNTKE
ncbi:MAG: hypothetical protein ABI855_08210 [Bacteroidota bacterium]